MAHANDGGHGTHASGASAGPRSSASYCRDATLNSGASGWSRKCRVSWYSGLASTVPRGTEPAAHAPAAAAASAAQPSGSGAAHAPGDELPGGDVCPAGHGARPRPSHTKPASHARHGAPASAGRNSPGAHEQLCTLQLPVLPAVRLPAGQRRGTFCSRGSALSGAHQWSTGHGRHSVADALSTARNCPRSAHGHSGSATAGPAHECSTLLAHTASTRGAPHDTHSPRAASGRLPAGHTHSPAAVLPGGAVACSGHAVLLPLAQKWSAGHGRHRFLTLRQCVVGAWSLSLNGNACAYSRWNSASSSRRSTNAARLAGCQPSSHSHTYVSPPPTRAREWLRHGSVRSADSATSALQISPSPHATHAVNSASAPALLVCPVHTQSRSEAARGASAWRPAGQRCTPPTDPSVQ